MNRGGWEGWKRNCICLLQESEENKEKAAVERTKIKERSSSSISDGLSLLAWQTGEMGWGEELEWRGEEEKRGQRCEEWKDEESERRKGSHHNTWQHWQRWRTDVVPRPQWLGRLSFDPKHREANTTQSHVSAYTCVCLCVCGYCECALGGWVSKKRIKSWEKPLTEC